MAARWIDGKALAAGILERVRLQRTALGARPLRLVSVYVGDDVSSAVYIRNQKRACERMEIRFDLEHLPATTTEEQLVEHLHALNHDDGVTGIILQRPLPPGMRQIRLQAKIHPDKDVEGLNPANIGSIVYGLPKLVPCTALAAVRCLKSTGVPLRGADVVMIGHSEVVGKPVAFLMLNEFATCTVCHIATQDLARKTRQADVIFTAVGKPGLLTGDMVKPGAVVIDIGIRQVPQLARDGTPLRGEDGQPLLRLSGDADFDSVAAVAGWVTPVPGGVGPVTVAMLIHNTIVAARLQQGLPIESALS
ncbi:MAG: bifunctional 5,10-methylenetetrahydrofolate dehydrogenase/5,10-methenyltetrahydrofolate cyclohydrolase [Planctomycetes bacterium]|nr:bifunctional 5,10-methylenetetrahydrofolate dehydrogenase/5,10-methenyltetrahydrofolate cyclohydrolase [Planctomycetota bacterium]